MKRSTRKKRRVEPETTYADPRTFRNLLPQIVMYCTAQTFARLKRVCKDFLRWLPAEHPALAQIRLGYAKWPHVCYPEKVALLFDAYYRRFVNELHRELQDYVTTSNEFKPLNPTMLHVNECTGIIHDRTRTATHIFSKSYMKTVRPERFVNQQWDLVHNVDLEEILIRYCYDPLPEYI